MDYKVDGIISDADIKELTAYFDTLQSNLFHQDYNLFDVDKRWPNKETKSDVSGFKKIESYAGLRLMSHYFLLYGPESFTKFHSDDDQRVGMTIVTQLRTSSDIVGGKALVQLPYRKNSRPSNKQVKRDKDPEKNGIAPLNAIIIPRVVDLADGQSLIYDRHLRHGVSQVEKGYRLVLVSWFFDSAYTGDDIDG